MSSTTVMVLLAAAGFIVYAVVQSRGDISGAEAWQKVAAGANLLDVRTAREFAAGHLDGALHIPLDALAGRHGELGAAGSEVVVYCQSGARSARAAAMLRRLGYRAHNLGAMSRALDR